MTVDSFISAIIERRYNSLGVNILLIQLKRIGDLILTTPAIAAVREKFPNANITLVISAEGKALAPAIAGVNKLLVMPRGLAGFGQPPRLRAANSITVSISRATTVPRCSSFSRARKSGSSRFESKCVQDFGRDFTTSSCRTGCATCM